MKDRLLFIGDIHGEFNVITRYIKLYEIKNAHIIQLGDFGVGFNTIEKEKRWLEMHHPTLIKNNVHVWVVRGNHDYKPHFDNDPFKLSNIHLVPDYSVLNLSDKNILFLGGATSIDRSRRYTKNQRNGIFENQRLGVESWWNDEVFVFDENKLNEFRNIDIVVSHTTPNFCPPDNTYGFGPLVNNFLKNYPDDNLKYDILNERNDITRAFEILQLNNNIKNHYYGHYHNSSSIMINNTVHRMLNINELYEEKDEK